MMHMDLVHELFLIKCPFLAQPGTGFDLGHLYIRNTQYVHLYAPWPMWWEIVILYNLVFSMPPFNNVLHFSSRCTSIYIRVKINKIGHMKQESIFSETLLALFLSESSENLAFFKEIYLDTWLLQLYFVVWL